ncbi:MAG: hypothetical protein QW478_06785 [Candidatus Micrarchaeaceae archaeon]
MSLYVNDKEFNKIETYIKSTTLTIESDTKLCPSKFLFKTLYGDINNLIDVKDIKKKISEFLPHSKYKLVNTVHTMLIVLSIYNNYYRNQSKLETLYFASLVYYNILLNKYVKYCDDNVLQLSIERVKSSNIFKQKGIINGLKYIASSVDNLYTDYNLDKNPEIIELMLYSLRTRIAQSLKSITKKYYEIKTESKTSLSNKDNYIRNIDRFKYKVLMLGYIDIPKECQLHKSKLELLKDVDMDLLEEALVEIYTKLGIILFNQQKVVSNLDKLTKIDTLVKEISGNKNDTNLKYCIVKTLLITSQT